MRQARLQKKRGGFNSRSRSTSHGRSSRETTSSVFARRFLLTSGERRPSRDISDADCPTHCSESCGRVRRRSYLAQTLVNMATTGRHANKLAGAEIWYQSAARAAEGTPIWQCSRPSTIINRLQDGRCPAREFGLSPCWHRSHADSQHEIARLTIRGALSWRNRNRELNTLLGNGSTHHLSRIIQQMWAPTKDAVSGCCAAMNELSQAGPILSRTCQRHPQRSGRPRAPLAVQPQPIELTSRVPTLRGDWSF